MKLRFPSSIPIPRCLQPFAVFGGALLLFPAGSQADTASVVTAANTLIATSVASGASPTVQTSTYTIELMQLAVVVTVVPTLILLSRGPSYAAVRITGAALAAAAALVWIGGRVAFQSKAPGPKPAAAWLTPAPSTQTNRS